MQTEQVSALHLLPTLFIRKTHRPADDSACAEVAAEAEAYLALSHSCNARQCIRCRLCMTELLKLPAQGQTRCMSQYLGILAEDDEQYPAQDAMVPHRSRCTSVQKIPPSQGGHAIWAYCPG